jgi:probable F420-dependent oxidoreductase
MSPVSSGADWLEHVRTVEAAGFSTLLLSDHFSSSPLAPIPAIAAAAAATTDLHVGSLVLNNDFRHPAVLAKEVLTLELLAPGRVEVGLGAGWMAQDYEQSGIDCERPGVRVQRFTETLDILRQQLDGERTTSSGSFYGVSRMPAVPAPDPRHRTPLLVGGSGRRMLTLAAQRADIVSVNWDVSAGAVTSDAVSSGTGSPTDERIGWVREAACARLDAIELHVQCYLLKVTDSPLEAVAAWCAALGADADPAEVADSPHVLVGSEAAIDEKLHAMRERWGFSYVSFLDSQMPKAIGIVDRLGGQ